MDEGLEGGKMVLGAHIKTHTHTQTIQLYILIPCPNQSPPKTTCSPFPHSFISQEEAAPPRGEIPHNPCLISPPAEKVSLGRMHNVLGPAQTQTPTVPFHPSPPPPFCSLPKLLLTPSREGGQCVSVGVEGASEACGQQRGRLWQLSAPVIQRRQR